MENLSYATQGSAGLDLKTKEDFELRPLACEWCNVGKIEIPKGYVGLIMPKSGLNFKKNIVARLGVIDSDYTGDIKVALDNRSVNTYAFKKGDAVAQLVVVPFIHLAGYDKKETERGEKGFGDCDK